MSRREVTHRTKTLAYAYATSPMASQLGHGKTGCWYAAEVDRFDDGTRDERVFCSSPHLATILPPFDHCALPVDRMTQWPYTASGEVRS